MRALVMICACVAGWCAGLSPVAVRAEVTAEQICSELSAAGGALPSGCTDLNPPAKPAPAPPVGPDGTLTQQTRESHIFFTAGGTALDAAAQTQLAALVAILETPPLRTACLRLIGHSDTTGGTELNEKIAATRAEAVATVLRAGLANPERVAEVLSAGETAPMSGLNPEAPEQRRVTLMARACP